MYVHTHTQFSGANPERLVAAIKHFLQGKGAEKGLRWVEGREGGWEEERGERERGREGKREEEGKRKGMIRKEEEGGGGGWVGRGGGKEGREEEGKREK